VGLSPDVIICRSSTRVEESTREKISVFCHVRPSHVLSVHDVSNIYHVPIILAEQNLHGILRCVRALNGQRWSAVWCGVVRCGVSSSADSSRPFSSLRFASSTTTLHNG
jgi:CTP synthase (UTP-ammonia lyase)